MGLREGSQVLRELLAATATGACVDHALVCLELIVVNLLPYAKSIVDLRSFVLQGDLLLCTNRLVLQLERKC